MESQISKQKARSHFSSCYASLRVDLSASSNYKESATAFGNKLLSIIEDCELFERNCDIDELKPKFKELSESVKAVVDSRYKSFNDKATGKIS